MNLIIFVLKHLYPKLFQLLLWQYNWVLPVTSDSHYLQLRKYDVIYHFRLKSAAASIWPFMLLQCMTSHIKVSSCMTSALISRHKYEHHGTRNMSVEWYKSVTQRMKFQKPPSTKKTDWQHSKCKYLTFTHLMHNSHVLILLIFIYSPALLTFAYDCF